MAVMLNMLPIEPKSTGVVNKCDTKNAKSAVGFAKLLTNETDKNTANVDSKDKADDNAQLMAAMSGLVSPVVLTVVDAPQGQDKVMNDVAKLISGVENQLVAVIPETITPQVAAQVAVAIQGTVSTQGTIPVRGTVSIQGTIPVRGTVSIQGTIPVQETASTQGTFPVQEKVQGIVPMQEILSVVPNLLPTEVQSVVSKSLASEQVVELEVPNMVANGQQSPLVNVVGLGVAKEQVATVVGPMIVVDPQQGKKQVSEAGVQGQNLLPNIAQTQADVKVNPEVLVDNPAVVNIVATTPLSTGNGLQVVKNAGKPLDSKKTISNEVNSNVIANRAEFQGLTVVAEQPVVTTSLAAEGKALTSKEPEVAEVISPSLGTRNTDTFVNLLNQQGMKIENQAGMTEAKSAVAQPVADPYNVTSQIVDQARLVAGNKNTEMIIQLKPEHLGELTFKVSVENGVVSASFHSNNAEVRNVIESSLYQLKQEMANQGLKIDNVGVYAGLGEFFSNGQQRENAQQPVIKVRNKKSEEEFIDALEAVDPMKSSVDALGVDYRI